LDNECSDNNSRFSYIFQNKFVRYRHVENHLEKLVIFIHPDVLLTVRCVERWRGGSGEAGGVEPTASVLKASI
jgi:hypothetical protein